MRSFLSDKRSICNVISHTVRAAVVVLTCPRADYAQVAL